MKKSFPILPNGRYSKPVKPLKSFIKKDSDKIITDPRGQWDHPGEITRIPSNQITMEGVPYPVMGISDTGDTQMMYPGQDYSYNGESVTEYPMMSRGGQKDQSIVCSNCGWTWKQSNAGSDPMSCHKCGGQATGQLMMRDGGWLEQYQTKGEVQQAKRLISIANTPSTFTGTLRNTVTNPTTQDISNKAKRMIASGQASDFEQSSPYKIFEAGMKILDPTGMLSYPDVKEAWNDGVHNYSDYVEPLGALPVIGKFGKTNMLAKSLMNYFKEAKLSKILRAIDKTDDVKTGIESIIKKQNGGEHGGLDRWFAEKWVDIKTGEECGRGEGDKRKGYPACRPSKRISSDTPKTASELSQAEKERFKREKTSSERIDYNHKKQMGGMILNETMENPYEMKSGGNVPTNPGLWSRAIAAAKAKYDVYPSAYANGFAAKWYKSKGGGWKAKAEYGMEVMATGGTNNPGFEALPDYVQAQILSNMGYGGYVPEMGMGGAPCYECGGTYAKGGQTDPDGEMALGQINAMITRLENLKKFVQPESDLEPWISDKPSVMNHSATAVDDYYTNNPQAQMEPEMMGEGGIPTRYKNMGFTRVGQKKQGDGQKKWKVLAKKGDKYKVVQGGYRGMQDFKQHHSEKRRDNFWSRMGGKNSSKAQDPFSPLYWHKRFGTWAEGGETFEEETPWILQKIKNKQPAVINNQPFDIVNNPFGIDKSWRPGDEKLKIKDNRTINATTGKAIRPTKDLVTERYNTKRMSNIASVAKLYGIDPYTLLAIDLQETGYGTKGRDPESESVGHTTGYELKDLTTPSKRGSDEEVFGDDYDFFARVYLEKMKEGRIAGLKDSLDIIQNYNGRGIVFPKTEKDYRGYDMKEIYGVTLPKSGINMAKYPLYGQRIFDLRDNVLKKEQNVRKLVSSAPKKRKGGQAGWLEKYEL